MKRRCDDWIESHLEYTVERSESPISYHLWGALSTLSCVMQRRCYVEWDVGGLYPNMYIGIIGPTGGRKRGPIEEVRRYMYRLRLPTMGERTTPEAVIQDLANSETLYKDYEEQRFKIHSSISCTVHEMSVFLGEGDRDFLGALTDWYDSGVVWRNNTKHVGRDHIVGVCVGIFAGSAPDWLPKSLTREAIKGGFIGRWLFIVEQGKRKALSIHDLPPRNEALYENLVFDLQQVREVYGRFMVSKKAKEWYNDWYLNIDGVKRIITDPFLHGYYERRAAHLHKIAMAVSISRDNELVLELKDFLRALQLLEDVEGQMSGAFVAIGPIRYLDEMRLVALTIEEAGSIERSAILKKFDRVIDVYVLEQIERTLLARGEIDTTNSAGDRTYTWTGGRE
jgi:hypothetical protein